VYILVRQQYGIGGPENELAWQLADIERRELIGHGRADFHGASRFDSDPTLLDFRPSDGKPRNFDLAAIVDEDALVCALQQRRIRAAILDAFQHEPLPAGHPLWSMDNVTLTSHHAGLNIPDDIIDFFLDNLARFQSGVQLRGLVDTARGY